MLQLLLLHSVVAAAASAALPSPSLELSALVEQLLLADPPWLLVFNAVVPLGTNSQAKPELRQCSRYHDGMLTW